MTLALEAIKEKEAEEYANKYMGNANSLMREATRIDFVCGWDSCHSHMQKEIAERDERIERAKVLIDKLDEEIDPRGLEHDVGFISHKGMDIHSELWELFNHPSDGGK